MSGQLGEGDLVDILSSNEGLPSTFGTITEVVPEKRGYLIRPHGLKGSFGWGYDEVKLIRKAPPLRPFWERFLWDL